MLLSLEELKRQINSARIAFIKAAPEWLNRQNFPEEWVDNWLKCLESNNPNDFLEAIRHKGLPLIAVDTLLTQDYPKLGKEKNFTHSRIYREYEINAVEPSPSLQALCFLTNLYEQLLQLEETLQPLPVFVNKQELDYLKIVVVNISKELNLAGDTPESIKTYEKRIKKAERLFEKAKKQASDEMHFFRQQHQDAHFDFLESLAFLQKKLVVAYDSHCDNGWFSFLYYDSWHKLLVEIAGSLFGKQGFAHPNQRKLVIDQKTVDSYTDSSKKSRNQIIRSCLNDLDQTIAFIKKDLDKAVNKLEAMDSRVYSQDQLLLAGRLPSSFNYIRWNMLSIYQFWARYNNEMRTGATDPLRLVQDNSQGVEGGNRLNRL